MNKNLLVGVGVAVVLLVGYMLFSNMNKQPYPAQPAATTTKQESASPSATPQEITVVLSEQNGSKESGTATLMEVDGKVRVALKMIGAKATVAQPAHIHVGPCPDVGAVKYPLTSPVDGMSETMLDVTLAELKSQLPLGINVHKSAKEASIYVTCADLTL